jgi:Mrp family chromosome partitioning ATPase
MFPAMLFGYADWQHYFAGGWIYPIKVKLALSGVLLILKIGQTDKRAIRRAKELLENTRIRLLGGILNGADIRDKRYRYSH